MRRIHIVGRKNSGKTTLIVELIRELSSRGLRVGTVKHTHHRHELDTPGKDSFRHRDAGAAAVGILSPGMDAVFRPRHPLDAEGDRYAAFAAVFEDCDLVLVEGDSQTAGAKVEVWRRDVTEAPMASNDDSVMAIISDDPIDISAPTWPRSDVTFLADRLLDIAADRD